MSGSKRDRKRPAGSLIIIGGHESKERDRVILREVARRVKGKLIIATVASHEPEGYFASYERAFAKLDVTDVVELYINERAEALDPKTLEIFEGAGGIFFTGGDQLRIASQIGDTPIEQQVRELYERGGVVAGTSAGASAMSETMLIKGINAESYRIGELNMAPGLGLIRDVIIDQHFAERGRIGRLLGAVAQNPRLLGLGLDEDTAIVVEQAKRFQVVGEGAAYVVDGRSVTSTNITEEDKDRTLSIFNVRLHLLSQGDKFDLQTRQPVSGAAGTVERELATSS